MSKPQASEKAQPKTLCEMNQFCCSCDKDIRIGELEAEITLLRKGLTEKDKEIEEIDYDLGRAIKLAKNLQSDKEKLKDKNEKLESDCNFLIDCSAEWAKAKGEVEGVLEGIRKHYEEMLKAYAKLDEKIAKLDEEPFDYLGHDSVNLGVSLDRLGVLLKPKSEKFRCPEFGNPNSSDACLQCPSNNECCDEEKRRRTQPKKKLCEIDEYNFDCSKCQAVCDEWDEGPEPSHVPKKGEIQPKSEAKNN